MDVAWWRVAGALLLCIGLALGGAMVLKRRLHGGGPLLVQRGRRMQLIESLRLGPHADAHLLRCDTREILLVATAHAVEVLSDGALSGGTAQP